MKVTAILLLTAISIYSYSQSFQVGVLMSSPAPAYKMEADIIVTDSTFILQSGSQQSVMKISSKELGYFYVTDGTATDKITVTPLTGKLKGFAYDHAIVQQKDQRFGGITITYFCRKRD